MSGPDAPNLGTSDDGRLTSKEAHDAVMRHGAEIEALLALRDEAKAEMERHYGEMQRISEEMDGLMSEVEDTFKGFLAANFAEESLRDIEALPVVPGERREDGV